MHPRFQDDLLLRHLHALLGPLEPDALALLQQSLEWLTVPGGHTLMQQGDPGDAIYISVAGEIGLRIPGSTRRLASFAPGVTLGEMAVLQHTRRSAEAVAESLTIFRRFHNKLKETANV